MKRDDGERNFQPQSARIAQAGQAHTDQAGKAFDQFLLRSHTPAPASAASSGANVAKASIDRQDSPRHVGSSRRTDQSSTDRASAVTGDRDVKSDQPVGRQTPADDTEAGDRATTHGPSAPAQTDPHKPPAEPGGQAPSESQGDTTTGVASDPATPQGVDPNDLQAGGGINVDLPAGTENGTDPQLVIGTPLGASGLSDDQVGDTDDVPNTTTQTGSGQPEQANHEQMIKVDLKDVSIPQQVGHDPVANAVVGSGDVPAGRTTIGDQATSTPVTQVAGQAQADADQLAVANTSGEGQASLSDGHGGAHTGGQHVASTAPTADQGAGQVMQGSSLPSPLPDQTAMLLGPSPVGATPPTAVDGPASQVQVPLPESEATKADPNVSRVLRGMRGVVHQNGGAVTLRLSPPEMGIVRIEMQIASGIVSAQLHTEHETARVLLTQQLSQLRSALEAQGLFVDKLAVQTMSQENATSTAQRDADQSAADGRSRGQYSTGDQPAGGRDGQEPSGEDQPEQQSATFEATLNMVA